MACVYTIVFGGEGPKAGEFGSAEPPWVEREYVKRWWMRAHHMEANSERWEKVGEHGQLVCEVSSEDWWRTKSMETLFGRIYWRVV